MTEPKPVLIRGGTTVRVPVTWLARGWLARRALTVLAGEEGIGKSLWWVRIAAAVTTGRALPEVNLPEREPMDVIVIAPEDQWSEVEDRIEAAGGDVSRLIEFAIEIEGYRVPPTFPRDADALVALCESESVNVGLVVGEAWLQTVGAGLMVKDPQQAVKALSPWKQIAERLSSAVLLIAHTNRFQGGETRDRIGATGQLRTFARSFLFAMRPVEEGGNRRSGTLVVGPEKGNNAGLDTAQEYRIAVHEIRESTPDDPGTTASVVYVRDTGQPIDNLDRESQDNREAARSATSKIGRAKDWIIDYMSAYPDGVPTAELDSAGAAAMKEMLISISTFRDAKSAIGSSVQPQGWKVGDPHVYRLHE